MELKTKVNAENGKQDLIMTREFDLPLELLFKAFSEPELVGQWRGVKALKFEARKHGSYQAEKRDESGNILFRVNGVFHEFIPGKKIIRTFEVENSPMGIMLEFYEFEKLTNDTSKLTVHTIFESVAIRDQVLHSANDQAMEDAFDKLEEIMNKQK
jgi:uncharacterized protein YndB with AHSA1/START domain